MAEVRQSLDQAKRLTGAGAMDATTAWRIDWRFAVKPATNGCGLGAFTTKTTITPTLPFWKPVATVTARDRQAWEFFFTALAQHEAGHARNALVAAAEIQRRCREIGRDPDCNSLKARINSLAGSIIQDHRKRDAEYDRRTAHGARPASLSP